MMATPTTRPRGFTALREIAGTLSMAMDLDTTLDLIARKTTEVMHVDSCSIYILDPDGENLRLQASTGLAKRALGRGILRMGEGMTGVAVANATPVYAAQAQADPRFKFVEHSQETNFTSLLAVPLILNGQAVGGMNVQTILEHHYSENEIELLSLIGDLVAGALVRAQNYDRQQAQLQELQALARVSEMVTSPQYFDEMLHVVTEMAAQTMGAAVCSLFLLDESGEYLELRSAERASSPYRHRLPHDVNAGIIGLVTRTGKSTYVPDVRQDPRYSNQALAQEEGLVSLLCEPLSVRDKVIGVLTCYTSEEREFTAEQYALFATLANQTALAIENARLITNAAIVREMHHRIKNNLQSVAMLMEMQIPDADKLDTKHVLETNINRIRSIASVHEALSERGFQLVDVKAVLTKIAKMTADMSLPPHSNITLQIQGENLSLPSRDATNLALVVTELIQNALAHGFVGLNAGIITVSLGSSPDENIVLVRDNGVGMPVSEPIAYGLGLEIAETLITQDLKGKFKINHLDQGTEFSIRLPKVRN